jgi:hypothetical protein
MQRRQQARFFCLADELNLDRAALLSPVGQIGQIIAPKDFGMI